MKVSEIKTIIYISIFLTAIVALIMLFNSNIWSISEIYRSVSSGMTLTVFFWTIFFAYGWRWCGLKHIFYRPDINGTWGGELCSNWKNENNEVIPPMPFYMIVRQNFLTIHITTFTDKSCSLSYSESFNLNKKNGRKNLSYLYRAETTQGSNALLEQNGATELRLIKQDKSLEGVYWSNAKTAGKIKVRLISKACVDSYEEAINIDKNER